jgi:hypothetical protein
MIEIEGMDLPNGHPLLMARGEHAMAQYEVHKATGYQTWTLDDPDVLDAMNALHKASDLPQELWEKRKAAQQREVERRKILDAEYVLNGPHCWGWDQKTEEAEFKKRWGVRPQDVDLSDIEAIKRHVYGG